MDRSLQAKEEAELDADEGACPVGPANDPLLLVIGMDGSGAQSRQDDRWDDDWSCDSLLRRAT